MFANKVVLVTGSSTGFGAGIVKKFAQLGANVVIIGLGTDKLEIEEVANECQKYDLNRKVSEILFFVTITKSLFLLAFDF